MRKIAYYLPNINLKENIDLGHCRLLKASEWNDSDLSINKKLFGNAHGALIEIDGFSTGDNYSSTTDKSICQELEIIKFSYFSYFISNIFFFASNNSFDMFRIIEKNKDPSFEHKVLLNNGVSGLWGSQDKYYASKALNFSFGCLTLEEYELKNYHSLRSLELNDNDFMMISLFNKTRNLYEASDFNDRVLFSRIAVEILSKKLKWKLSNITEKFLDKAFSIIQVNKPENEKIEKFFIENVENKKESIKNNIEKYLNDLKDARHNLTHEGIQSNQFVNISYFLAWFPIAFVLSFDTKEIEQDFVLRIIFLLAASGTDIQKWHKESFKTATKKTTLECFEEISHRMPRLISENNYKYIECYLERFKRAIAS